MKIASDIERIEQQAKIEKLRESPHILHPAGGLTENFVYEPISVGNYVYETREQIRGIAELHVDFEDAEKRRNPHWFLEVNGERCYFIKKPPKEFLFEMPNTGLVEKWVKGEKQSLTTQQVWKLNNVYLRTFLDFPHEHEFNISLLFILQTWLTEVLPVVFYLGIKGEFGGGKTVTGEAITFVCRHGYLTGNLSPAFVARAIQDQKITLMVDELDTIAGTKDSDLNGIFRQGYRKGLKYSRINPDTLEAESYFVFGSKLFTVHSETEEALQTRTIPLHVRETEKPEYPIVNLDKKGFSGQIYTENFLWYMDNILHVRDNETHIFNGLNSTLDTLDSLALTVSEFKESKHAEKLRATLYSRKKTFISEGQVKQVSQVTGRNTELMYLCFILSNIVKVRCDDDIDKTFKQKLIEEGERTEVGFLGMLKDVLISEWTEKQNDERYMTKSGYLKISNKELYDVYNRKMKKEYDRGLSPAKFKGYMLEFGFTDALNRKKMEVPLPGEKEAKSRLCNIFTNRVLRKLGLNADEKGKEKGSLEKLKEIEQWIIENKDSDGLVDTLELTKKIVEFQLKPQLIVEKLRKEGFIRDVPVMGKFGVK